MKPPLYMPAWKVCFEDRFHGLFDQKECSHARTEKTALALVYLSLIPALIPITAMAQNWEMTSGLPAQQDVHRGTKEIRGCASPGG